jgi:hypothetical protein
MKVVPSGDSTQKLVLISDISFSMDDKTSLNYKTGASFPAIARWFFEK